MTWNAYEICPIDEKWEFLQTLEQTRIALASKKPDAFAPEDDDRLLRFETDWKNAKAKARKLNWEGDVRGCVRVFWLPDEFELTYGFVWKQSNNGTTFVVSPKPLPHLQDL